MKRTSVDGVLALSLLLLLLLLRLVWVNDPSDEFRASSSPGGDADVADEQIMPSLSSGCVPLSDHGRDADDVEEEEAAAAAAAAEEGARNASSPSGSCAIPSRSAGFGDDCRSRRRADGSRRRAIAATVDASEVS